MIRLDSFPTHELGGIRYRCGRAQPFGATLMTDDGTINFSVFSKEATACELLLYNKGEREPFFDKKVFYDCRQDEERAIFR